MRLIPLLALFFISISLMGQEEEPKNNLLLDGFVKIESDKALPNHKIEIKAEDGTVLETVYSNELGRFKAYFPFDEVREFWFSNAGYHTKILVVDTRNVPKAEQEWGYEYGGFNVNLKPMGLENHTVTKVAALRYSPTVQNFDFELL